MHLFLLLWSLWVCCWIGFCSPDPLVEKIGAAHREVNTSSSAGNPPCAGFCAHGVSLTLGAALAGAQVCMLSPREMDANCFQGGCADSHPPTMCEGCPTQGPACERPGRTVPVRASQGAGDASAAPSVPDGSTFSSVRWPLGHPCP